MKRCVIIGGAEIADYPFIKEYLRKDDFFIFCDSGLKHMDGLGAAPDLIIGDFDSHEDPHLPVETIVLPHVKDDTDTFYAAKEGVKRGFREVLLLGAAGGRPDHTLGNIFILYYLQEAGVDALLVDDYSEMEVIGSRPGFISDRYLCFSLINMTGRAKGIFIKNAMYELNDAEIKAGHQYGISNEVLPGRTAEVRINDGRLLLIKVLREQGT